MRRLLVAVLVLGVALAALVGGESRVEAQQQPTITLSPTSAPAGVGGTYNIVVTGAGYPPSTPIAIGWDGTAIASTTSNGSGGFSVTINPARGAADYHFVQACATRFSLCASADFEAFPQLTLAPGCYSPGVSQTLTVNGNGWAAGAEVFVAYDYPSNTVRSAIPGNDTRFAVTFPGVSPSSGDIVIFAEQPRREVSSRTVWRACPPPTTTTSTSTTVPDTIPDTTTTRPTTGGGGPTTTTSTTIPTIVSIPPPTPGATLTVTPSLGPGGFVTSASGTGFPANQPVTLGWSPGIGIYSTTAGPDGTFTTPMLVMNRDVLGPRTLVATSGAVSASASFLVVPSTVQPSGKDVAQISRVRRFLQR